MAGLLGAFLVVLFTPLPPFALASAGGAMLYVTVDGMIPESHRHGHDKAATLDRVPGFAMMTILEAVFA